MAMIGRGAAVAQVKGVELHGKLAFTAWLGVHAALMTGGSNRVDAFKSWARDYFGKERAPQALDRSGTPRMRLGRRRRRRDSGRHRIGRARDEPATERYDVIIIGSGAGGGTLARHLAPSGKRILILERGDWLPREAATGTRRRSSSTTATSRRRRGTTTRTSPSSPASTTRSVARRSCTGRRCTGCARRTSASSAITAASPRPGRSRTTTSSRTTPRRAALRGPRQPRRGPDRGARQRPVPIPGADPRAADPATVRRPGAGRLPPVPRTVRRPPARGRPAQQPLHPVPDLRRLPVPRPGEVRCRDARGPTRARAPERDHPDASHRAPPRDERCRIGGRAGDRRAGRRAGDVRRRPRGRLGRGRQLGQDPARVGQRPPPERAGQRLRDGRPELHVPQQHGRPGDLQGTEPDDVPEDARAERLLLRDEGLRLPDGQHPDGRQVRRRDVQGREAAPDQARADVLADRRGDPCRRLLAVDRGPARARTTA